MKSAREKPTTSSPKRSRNGLLPDSLRTKRRHSALTSSRTLPMVATGSRWTFLTNHSHVLILLSRNPTLVLREVALQVGITERAVQRIIADLESGGIIKRDRVGRQNHYRIRANQPLRHGIESHRMVGELLALINGAQG